MRDHRALWVLVALAVVAAGCGNRLSRDEVLGQNVVRAGDAQVSPVATDGVGATDGDAVAPDAGSSGDAIGQAAVADVAVLAVVGERAHLALVPGRLLLLLGERRGGLGVRRVLGSHVPIPTHVEASRPGAPRR